MHSLLRLVGIGLDPWTVDSGKAATIVGNQQVIAECDGKGVPGDAVPGELQHSLCAGALTKPCT